jgi:trans-aconitate methyltransferase
MVPYLERLPPASHAAFLARYREAMREALPASPLFFGFKRTLFAATRAA